MNTIGYFEIQSSDCQREIKFYEAVFGWKFIKEEFVPIEYYRIETDGINGGLLTASCSHASIAKRHQCFCMLRYGKKL